MDDPRRFVPVWDPLLRILHWWNALALFGQVATGLAFGVIGEGIEAELKSTLVTVHSVFGYAFGAGITLRILWLFMGPPEARLKDMLPVTKRGVAVFVDTIKFYLRGLRGAPPLYFAHNTLAGPIYAGFFLLAAIQVVTGATTLGLSPDDRAASDVLAIHGINFLLILLFIPAHIFAVFVHELVEKHSIISAMVHGKKVFTDEEAEALEIPTPAPVTSTKENNHV